MDGQLLETLLKNDGFCENLRKEVESLRSIMNTRENLQ